jgi:hypothetical protein
MLSGMAWSPFPGKPSDAARGSRTCANGGVIHACEPGERNNGFAADVLAARRRAAMCKSKLCGIRILRRKPQRIRRDSDEAMMLEDWMCVGAPSTR